MFTFAVTMFALVFYHDPGYIHETVILFNQIGHLKGVPEYDLIDEFLNGEEKILN